MGKQSQAWKDLEREVAEELKGKRVLRGGDFSQEGVDVEVEDFPGLRIDAKYRAAWSHASYLKECADKYVKEPGQMALLVTKKKRQRGAIACVSLKDFGMMLDTIRQLRNDVKVAQEQTAAALRLADRVTAITNPRIVHRVLAPLDGGPHPGGASPHRGVFPGIELDAGAKVSEGAPMTPPVIGTAPGGFGEIPSMGNAEDATMGPPGQETGEPKNSGAGAPSFSLSSNFFQGPLLKEVREQKP